MCESVFLRVHYFIQVPTLPGIRRRRLAGAERGSRFSQVALNPLCDWVCATEHAPRSPFHVLERCHGLAPAFQRVLDMSAHKYTALCRVCERLQADKARS